MVGQLYPLVNQAQLLTNVGLWTDGVHRTNLVLATVQGAKDSWAVITDEIPSLGFVKLSDHLTTAARLQNAA
jgi:hypothetical protein